MGAPPPNRALRLATVCAALAGATVAIVVMIQRWPESGAPQAASKDHEAEPEAPPSPPVFPLPPRTPSPYLNTQAEAKWIGSLACRECHAANHRSYLLTTHSRALSDVDPAAEPPDGAFLHKASGRSYRVYRQDGKLRHAESLRSEDGREVARIDRPVRYLVGSGHFSRTYLVETNGFLHESPITWYESKNAWGLSPGYDRANHAGFERPVGRDCMACHAGSVEPIDDSFHRLKFRELSIGCENCHGPGSLHRELRLSRKPAPGLKDFTIVNPAKLSRELREDVCASCHQSGPARVVLRGRSPSGFRPGLPLADFLVNYRLKTGSDKMTVVGHSEQLHASACYQKSPNLGCTTCHDPHSERKPADPVAFFRQKCLDCHEKNKPCGLALEKRLAKEPRDNCMVCHMPRGETEIPHIAFTHHRIGVPGKRAPSKRLLELVPCADVSRLGAIDQQRNLGLAYLEASRTEPNRDRAIAFRLQARSLLEAVLAAGLKDGPAAAGCAEIYWGEAPARARLFAREAMKDRGQPAKFRLASLLVLGYSDVQSRNFPDAIGPLEDMVRSRRVADDWRLLGMSYLRSNDAKKALPALQEALAIRPFRASVHAGLAEAYRALGDAARADEHQAKAKWLKDHKQD